MLTSRRDLHGVFRVLRTARSTIMLAEMSHCHDDPAPLKALQAEIYRERVLRARQLTVQQRLNEVFELSNHMFGMMLGGAMHRLNTRDESQGWIEVRRWMHRLDRVHDRGFYLPEKSTVA